jgi:hypothetical protein
MTQKRPRYSGIAVTVAGVLLAALVRAEPLRLILSLAVFFVGVYLYWREGNRTAAVGTLAFVGIFTGVLLLFAYHVI